MRGIEIDIDELLGFMFLVGLRYSVGRKQELVRRCCS